MIGMENIIIIDVSDIADGFPNDLFVVKLGIGCNLAGNGYAITLYEGFAGNPALWVL